MSFATSIIKRTPKPIFDADAFLTAMWLLYWRTPGRNTAPGEAVDLGEIGSSPEKSWERLMPYSPAQRCSQSQVSE